MFSTSDEENKNERLHDDARTFVITGFSNQEAKRSEGKTGGFRSR